jgi:PleD family two-component response regulator
LRRLSAVILSVMRQVDFAARYGGEEFLIVLPDTASAARMRLPNVCASGGRHRSWCMTR